MSFLPPWPDLKYPNDGKTDRDIAYLKAINTLYERLIMTLPIVKEG